MKSLLKVAKGLAAATLIGLSSLPAHSAVIELALVLDGSGSISSTDFSLQTQAYANIFGSGTFYDDFVVGDDDLWVNTWQFGTNVQDETGGWMLINDNASAAAFGATFNSITQLRGWTNTSSATVAAANSIVANGIISDRRIIDVSTDGAPTLCEPSCFGQTNDSQGADDAAVFAADYASSNFGITVNAIGVGNALNSNSGQAFLSAYTTAGNGFFELAQDFGAFQSALEDKLFREINDVPTEVSEPATLALFGLGLAGLAATRRKQKS